MPEIQLRSDDGEVIDQVDIPSGDDGVTSDENMELAEGLAMLLDQCGYDYSVGSTGGIDLEWYCSTEAHDSEFEDRHNINITHSP